MRHIEPKFSPARWIFCSLWVWIHQCYAVTPTDPRSVTSLHVADFHPASTAALSSVDELSSASWSPDGKYVLYDSLQSGIGNIWIADVVTKQSRQVAAANEAQSYPAWSPDGKQILYLADHDGDEHYDIFVVDVAGGRVQNVTQTPSESETFASWAPNSREIVFSSRAINSAAARIGIVDVPSRRIRFVTTNPSQDRRHASPVWRSIST
jgi:Tol biopolymer transport system component